jgi:general secretion pathway protein K
MIEGMKTLRKKQIGQRGIALVLTLLILTILVVTGLELNRAMRVEASLAGNFRDLTQASYIAQSGVEIARVVLQEDDLTYDGPDERWAQFEVLAYLSHQLFPEGYFTGRIVDESGKFNPNGMVTRYGTVEQKKKDQLERLLMLLGHDPGVVDAILDWLDPDELRRTLGAEREYYMLRKPPYVPKNGPLDSLGEMLLIKGISPEVFYGTDTKKALRDYLTVYSDSSSDPRMIGIAPKININTASLPVLMSLFPKVDQGMAQAVMDYRRLKPFRKPEELRSIPGWNDIYPAISSEIDVRSNYFSLEITGIYHEARALVQAVVKREGRQIRVVFWKAS